MSANSRTIELSVAVASFLAAVAFAFTSLLIAADQEVTAGNCAVIAQFLLLTASIFGIDYKYSVIRKDSFQGTGNTSSRC